MSASLDRLLADLAAAPPDDRCVSMEAEIVRRIARLRDDARILAELAPVRVATIVLALAMGVATGSALAASALLTSEPYAVLSSAGQFAPSTLLEGGH
jgi:hypothetical protein